MRDISEALRQLARDAHAQGPLPMPHMARLRGLNAEVRTLRRATLETTLARAEMNQCRGC